MQRNQRDDRILQSKMWSHEGGNGREEVEEI